MELHEGDYRRSWIVCRRVAFFLESTPMSSGFIQGRAHGGAGGEYPPGNQTKTEP